jgi:hypothetical protein
MDQAKKGAVDVEFHEVSSLNLSDLKPGDVSTHTEPDRAPAKAEAEYLAFPDVPPEAEPAGGDAVAYFGEQIRKLLPKYSDSQYLYLKDNCFVDCELSAWEECVLNPKYHQRLVDWCKNTLPRYVETIKKEKKK